MIDHGPIAITRASPSMISPPASATPRTAPLGWRTKAFEALGRWQREGKLLQTEDVAVGLENAPRTLMRLFTGENFGKQLLRIADQPLP
jgi:hypothetical protein